MRVVLQRVKRANCIVNKEVVSEINKGYLLLVGFTHTDTSENIDYMVDKFQSFHAMKEQVENGYEYYIINDGESIEVKCQFCNKAYNFEIEELMVRVRALLKRSSKIPKSTAVRDLLTYKEITLRGFVLQEIVFCWKTLSLQQKIKLMEVHHRHLMLS